LREHRAGCHFRPPSFPFAALLLAVARPVRPSNPSKSTLAHEAVAAVVLHKHHLSICVGAGLIRFVYGSHSRMVADLSPSTKIHFRSHFRGFSSLVRGEGRYNQGSFEYFAQGCGCWVFAFVFIMPTRS